MDLPLLLFDQFPELGAEEKKAFISQMEILHVARGDLLQQENVVCDYLYFVVEGSLRSFYVKENKDVTVSFTLDREFTTAMHSFISRKPSYENIEAMEKTTVARISHQAMQELFATYIGLERTYRIILEQYYILLEEQLIFAKFKSAKERYLTLMDSRPKVIHKASVGQIASYLDMSIETLSRIRSKI